MSAPTEVWLVVSESGGNNDISASYHVVPGTALASHRVPKELAFYAYLVGDTHSVDFGTEARDCKVVNFFGKTFRLADVTCKLTDRSDPGLRSQAEAACQEYLNLSSSIKQLQEERVQVTIPLALAARINAVCKKVEQSVTDSSDQLVQLCGTESTAAVTALALTKKTHTTCFMVFFSCGKYKSQVGKKDLLDGIDDEEFAAYIGMFVALCLIPDLNLILFCTKRPSLTSTSRTSNPSTGVTRRNSWS